MIQFVIVENKEEVHKKIVELIETYERLNQKKQDIKLKYLISARVKLHRAQKQITQEQLAKELGVKRLQVLRWENGQSQPSPVMIKLLQEKGILPDLS
ncbi:MAG: helix-turn-helix transcriptional regulator [Candidatus Omnitrophota bacterium]|jgi:DNA-binding transcriptional regulator YiaG